MKPKRILSFLLATTMTISLLPTFTLTASAGETPTATTEKNITLGTSALSGYDSTNGYDYIYYGTYNNKAVKWRVLDMDYKYNKDDTSETGMLVLSENALAKTQFGTNSIWNGSTAQTWCKNMYDSSFGANEQKYILETNSDDILNNDRLLFLSYDEAYNTNYFPNDNNRVANLNGNAVWWWLRSPCNPISVDCVDDIGSFNFDTVLFDITAARPAFNLNPASVLFTSIANGGKQINAGTLNKNDDYVPATNEKYEYKLTLLDSDRNFTVSDKSAKSVKAGDTISLEYKEAEKGDNEYVSAMIVNDKNEVLYYGQLEKAELGTVVIDDFTVPQDIPDGKYTLNLFNEQINGDKKTDSSSEFQKITLNVKGIPKASDFTFNQPSDLTYDGNAKEATVTSNKSRMGAITVKYYDENGNPLSSAPTNAGTYKVKIDVAEETNYYAANDLTADNWKFTIEKATPTVSAPRAKTGLVYDNTEKELIAPGKTTDGTEMQYSLDNVNYGTEIPKGKNADKYKVYYKVIGNDNYNNVDEKFVEVEISKAKVTKPAENTTLFTYNKDVQTYSLTESELYTISNNTRTDAGSQDVTVALKDTDNYEWTDGTTDDLTYTFTIKEATITPTITLTAPVKYATPETSIDTDEYTATVVWSPTVEANGTFAKNTEYTATITVTPKTNYTVSGIGENGYTLDGATSVTNDADKGVVTAVFPKTAGSSGGGGSLTSRYTVKFDTDGGNTITNQTVTKNSKATEPAKPTKEGYIFDGWYTDSKFTTEYDFDTKVTKNITLYAKWVEDEVGEPSDDKKGDEQKPSENEWKNPFTDVTKADWFFDNVRYANENGLMSGTTDTTFAPNDNLTRAMLVTVLYRAEGEPAVNKSIPFADVNASQYYANAVIWAEQNGIVKGVTETEFAPDENITREQIAAIIYRYAKFKGYDVSVGEDTNILSYTDFDEISEYAIEAMQYAVGSGLIKGKTETTLNPKDNATRAEIAAILNRFIEGNK